MSKKIKWWEPRFGNEEKRLICQAIDRSFPNEGEMTALFEEKISNLLGSKFAVTVTSGTAAMFLSLKALGVGHGDEVIVPDITFIATANAVSMCGATPVLVDVDPKSLTLSPEKFLQAVSDKTKAVIPVHISGRAADLQAILEIAESHNIYVVEDAAEAFMSKYHDKYLGTYGTTGCFSLSAHKTITTGQGGVIITDNEEIHERLRELKDQGRHGRGPGGDDLHYAIGYNFKFTDLQAALGLGQLTVLDSRIDRMKRTYQMYKEELDNIEGISLFSFKVVDGEFPQWTDALVEDRNELDNYLQNLKIDCRKFWLPLHTQTPYLMPDDHFTTSTELSQKAIWLPSAFTLTDADVLTVCSEIKRYYQQD
jgi:perosamine synthetase